MSAGPHILRCADCGAERRSHRRPDSRYAPRICNPCKIAWRTREHHVFMRSRWPGREAQGRSLRSGS